MVDWQRHRSFVIHCQPGYRPWTGRTCLCGAGRRSDLDRWRRHDFVSRASQPSNLNARQRNYSLRGLGRMVTALPYIARENRAVSVGLVERLGGNKRGQSLTAAERCFGRRSAVSLPWRQSAPGRRSLFLIGPRHERQHWRRSAALRERSFQRRSVRQRRRAPRR